MLPLSLLAQVGLTRHPDCKQSQAQHIRLIGSIGFLTGCKSHCMEDTEILAIPSALHMLTTFQNIGASA